MSAIVWIVCAVPARKGAHERSSSEIAELLWHTRVVNIAIDPITLVCPRCHAKPGDACEVILGEEPGFVHIERIRAATAANFMAKKRFDRDGM
jgi:hypothetical protein